MATSATNSYEPGNKEEQLHPRPALSIGLPVYNGEAFLAEAIDSILAQTFTDFELIISDNASTDSTESICRDRAQKDGRIRYQRQLSNIGAMKNFNLLVELARGKYFKWAAHDDIHAPHYVEYCIGVLESDPGVVLAFPRAQDIDADGNLIARKSAGLKTNSAVASVRFAELIRMDYSCESIFGVMRTAELRRTPLLSNYADCDRVLLTEIGLSGRIQEIPDYLFIHRQHENRSVRQFKSRQKRAAWFDPSQAGRPVFPYNRQFWGYIDVVARSRRSMGQKLRCLAHMGIWVVRNSGGLLEDLVYALQYVLRPVKHLVTSPSTREKKQS